MTDNVIRLIDREVVKHSSAIQIQGTVGLLARRTWNVLLANAYDKLTIADEHSIKIKDLADALEFASHDTDTLKGAVKEMFGLFVEWNVLGKDGETWGAMTLLSRAKIERGVVTYAYDSKLRELLHEPKMYARIKLSLQNAFRSKYSLILYELMHDYFDAERQCGETPWISVEKFRELMGVDESQYPAFKALSQWVIRVAVDEVSDRTDIAVEVDYQRESRRVVALKFKAKARKGKKVKVRKPSPIPKSPTKKKSPRPHSREWDGPSDTGFGVGW